MERPLPRESGEGQTAAVHEDSTITLRPYEAVAVLL